MDFEFPPGLAALAGIIPLTIIYLLKPHPKQVILPSLMFVRRVSLNVLDSRRRLSKRITDPLFFLQLLALVLLSAALAGPLIEEVSGDSEKVIIILDSSASMSAVDRFSEARTIAINGLGQENTIIAAKSIPVVLAKGLDAADAKEVLENLEAGNTRGDLPKTLLSAINDNENRNGKILVISDFEHWNGKAPETYVDLARAGNIELEFRQVGKKTPNYAIVAGHLTDLNDGTYEYTCSVKNFDENGTELEVRLESKYGQTSLQQVSNSISLAAFETQQITFSNIPKGTSTVEILNKDTIACDNTAYISIPEIPQKKILVLTDLDPAVNRSALGTALSLMPDAAVSVHYTPPGGLPEDFEKYDMIVVNHKYNPLSSGNARKIAAYAKSEKDLVVIGNGCLFNHSEMRGLYPVLPVDLKSVKEGGSRTIETAGSGRQIFEDVSFGEVYLQKALVSTPKEDAVVLAELDDFGPLVCTWDLNNGTTAYVGFSDISESEPWNNFHTVATYPVFWAKLLKYIWGVGDISETNVKTGRYQAFDQSLKIKTPTETINSRFVYYGECGFYCLDQKTIAASLYDPLESNTYTENRLDLPGGPEEVQKQTLYTKSPRKPRRYLIYSLLLLLILENIIMSRRRTI